MEGSKDFAAKGLELKVSADKPFASGFRDCWMQELRLFAWVRGLEFRVHDS